MHFLALNCRTKIQILRMVLSFQRRLHLWLNLFQAENVVDKQTPIPRPTTPLFCCFSNLNSARRLVEDTALVWWSEKGKQIMVQPLTDICICATSMPDICRKKEGLALTRREGEGNYKEEIFWSWTLTGPGHPFPLCWPAYIPTSGHSDTWTWGHHPHILD